MLEMCRSRAQYIKKFLPFYFLPIYFSFFLNHQKLQILQRTLNTDFDLDFFVYKKTNIKSWRQFIQCKQSQHLFIDFVVLVKTLYTHLCQLLYCLFMKKLI